MWETITDVWRIARQLPQSETARWCSFAANGVIVIVATWAVLKRAWKWLRVGKPPNNDDAWPEG